MKFTNRDHYPEAFANAVQKIGAKYSKGLARYSITELLSPPQMRYLTKKHWDELEEDVSDRLWSAHGQSMHLLLEQAESEGEKEIRLQMELGGVTISGQIDFYDPKQKLLIDYKTCSVWKFWGKEFDDWTAQVNAYALLLEESGRPVERGEILALCRDFRTNEPKRNPRMAEWYPKKPVVLMEMELWSKKATRLYFEERIRLHEAASQGTTILCKENERWKNNARCQSYCAVSEFCPQYQEILKQGVNE